MLSLEICAEEPQKAWNRLKSVQRKWHKNIFADVFTVYISTVQILTSNIIGSWLSCYLSKQWHEEQEIQQSISDGERREWERVTSDRLRIRLGRPWLFLLNVKFSRKKKKLCLLRSHFRIPGLRFRRVCNVKLEGKIHGIEFRMNQW